MQPDRAGTSMRNFHIGYRVGLILLAPAFANAQGWSSDPANNLIIANRSGEETQPKILPRADGGFYIAWFDNSDGGYDVRLQRLDVNGVELWTHNGILVADRSHSSTTDYGVAIDIDGNALLSFQCCTQGAADERLRVYKYSPAGAALFASGGIAVSTLSEGQQVSHITGTSDGNAVVIWTNNAGQGRAQKLDSNGTPLWGATGTTLPGPATGLKFVADVKPGSNGDAIIAWSNQAASVRLLRAQKLASADGAVLWGTDGIRISDTGGLSPGYFPKFQPDGSGGAVFAVGDFVGVTPLVRVQHLDTSGARLYGNDGVLVTSNSTRGHTSPAASYDPASGDLYVAWIDQQQVGGDITHGLYAQRIDATGARGFSETGVELVPMTVATNGAQALSQVVVLPAPQGMLATWVTGNTSVVAHPISTLRVDATGASVWAAAAHIKTSATSTSRLTAVTSTAGYAAFAWADSADGQTQSNDLRGQRLLYSGAFGDGLFANGFEGL